MRIFQDQYFISKMIICVVTFYSPRYRETPRSDEYQQFYKSNEMKNENSYKSIKFCDDL